MKQITLSGKTYALWETWTEVPKALLPQVLRLLYVEPASGQTYHQILRIALGYTSNEWKRLMRHYFGWERTEEQRENNAEVLADALQHLKWMWTQELTVKPFLCLEVEGQTFWLPDDDFLTMGYGELTDAYIHARAFIEQLVEGEERLNYLMATLCRPERPTKEANDENWNGDIREAYNEHSARLRVKLWETADYADKILVLMWFLGTLKDFTERFQVWDEEATGPLPEDEYPGQSWIKNQHLLSEKQIFGGMAATKKANVHEVFTFLEENKKDMIAKRKTERAQNQTKP